MNSEKQSTNLQMILREVNRVGEGQKNVPKLRFKGYEDAWEQRKLGEEVQIVMGQSPKGENYTDNPEDYILVQGNADMKDGKVFPRVWTTQVTKQAHKGDIILSVRAPVGDIGKTNYDVVIGRGVAAVKGNEFFYQLLGKLKLDGYWTKSSTGSTFDSINSNEIKNAKVTIPDTNEQLFIGDYFQGLDNLITLHQRKYDALKTMKKTLLSKMFPKDGEDVPEIRFKGFTDAWEQRKLGEITEKFEYGLNAAATDFDGVNQYLRITDIDDETREFNKTSLTSPDTNLDFADNYILKQGDILFARTGASVGKTYQYKESDGRVYYAGFLIRARLLSGFNVGFIFQNTLTKRYENFISITSQRSGQPGVNAQEYASFKLLLPKFEEQEQIADLFTNLDNLITLHQRKLDELKNIKKTLLQQMFV